MNLNDLLSHAEKAQARARKEMIIMKDSGHCLRVGHLQHALDSVNHRKRGDLVTVFGSLS